MGPINCVIGVEFGAMIVVWVFNDPIRDSNVDNF